MTTQFIALLRHLSAAKNIVDAYPNYSPEQLIESRVQLDCAVLAGAEAALVAFITEHRHASTAAYLSAP